jgi:signal transduction histidine kinase
MALTIFRLIPFGVAVVLALLTAVAYWQSRRRYLLVWTVVWCVAVAYYLAQVVTVSSDPESTARADTFSRLGVIAASLGWARSIGFWVGARALVNRPISRGGMICVAVCTLLWIPLSTEVMGSAHAALLNRTSYACLFFAAAVALLWHRPASMVFVVAGSAFVLLGVQGATATYLVMDMTGNMVASWLSNTLMLTVGLAVLGRLLEEEREVADARSRELAAANARLAELDRLKSDFVSMVSHELRTPLGLIKGYVGTLLRRDAPLDEPTREEFLQVIDEETDRLTELVTNLLDMSRIEAGTLRVDRRPLRLDRLLADCAERLCAREPGRSLDVAIPAPLPPVLADERRIAQVVDNLLTNAVRYSPEATPVLLGAQAVNGGVEVRVTDQGIGIPVDKQAQVFDKFFRVDASDTRRFAGTGLGLAICRGIVQAHGGAIWLQSEPGRGSTFTFCIPAGEEAQGGPD